MDQLEYSWNDSMRSGDALVDSQHKELIRQLNVLLHAMSGGQASAQVNATLDFLGKYAVEHFAHEEQCMDRFRCPLAAANKQAHAEFLAKFTAFRKEIHADQAKSTVIAIRMLRELSAWLVQHIRNIDAKMLPYATAAQK